MGNQPSITSVTTAQQPPVDLLQILKEAIDEWVSDEPPRIRPSTLGGCIRKNYFNLVEGRAQAVDDEDFMLEWGEKDAVTHGYLVMGKLLEILVTPAMEKHGYKRQCLVVIDKSENFFGHCDFYYYHSATDTGYVVDIKTTGVKNLDYIPSDKHIVQVQLYMHGILHGEIWETDSKRDPIRRLPTPRSCKGGLLYIVRENPSIRTAMQAFWFDYDPDIVKMGFANRKKLQKAIETQTPPPIPDGYNPYTFPCSYVTYGAPVKCPYWERCWRDKISEGAMEEEVANLIKAYVKYMRAKKEWEAYRQVFIETTSSLPHLKIVTPQGVVEKTVRITGKPSVKRLISLLLQEGKLTKQEADIYYERSMTHYEQATVRVYPNKAVFQDDEYKDEEE